MAFAFILLFFDAHQTHAGDIDLVSIKKVQIIPDPDDSLDLSDVLSLSKTTDYNRKWSFLTEEKSVWLIIDSIGSLINRINGPYSFSVIGNAHKIELFYFQKGLGWRQINGGLYSMVYDEGNRISYPNFTFDEIATSYPLVLKVTDAMIPVMAFQAQADIAKKHYQKLILTSIIIGSMLFILVINLVRWISSREVVFGLYALYVLLLFLNVVAYAGNNIIYFLMDISPTAKYHLQFFSVHLMTITIGLYGITFLKLKTKAPGFYRAILIYIIIFLLFGVYRFYVQDGPLMANLLTITMMVLPATAGAKMWKSGQRYAAFYVIGYGVFILTGIIYSLMQGIDSAYPYLYPIPIYFVGIFAEILLLNISLNSSIDDERRAAQKEVATTHRELIDFQMDQNRVLEEKVKERTQELESTLNNLKKTQSQLIESEKMASLGTLSAGVGHEINNPLNFIKGGVSGLGSYLEKKFGSDDKTNQLIEIVHEGIDRATQIVRSLSHFSKSGTAMDEKCNINQIIDNCLILMRSKFNGRIEIFKEYKDNPLIVLGNEGKLHQAISNILTNAEQAIEDSGFIQIKTELLANGVGLVITDSGIGINKRVLSKVMDPFFTTKDPGVGTGLGLSITYNIIQEHGGTIKIESVLGEGSKVIIHFPFEEKQATS